MDAFHQACLEAIAAGRRAQAAARYAYALASDPLIVFGGDFNYEICEAAVDLVSAEVLQHLAYFPGQGMDPNGTTYLAEMADALYVKYAIPSSCTFTGFEGQRVRRRVYDYFGVSCDIGQAMIGDACSFDAAITMSDHRPVAIRLRVRQPNGLDARAANSHTVAPKPARARTYRRRLPTRWGLHDSREKSGLTRR